MKRKIISIIILILMITILHSVSVYLGLYEKNIQIDVPQHILGGIALGIFWLILLKPEKNKISSKIIFLSTISFAVLGSIVWELFEFSLSNLLPEFSNNLKLYSSTVEDLLSDVTSGLIGGILVAIYQRKLNM